MLMTKGRPCSICQHPERDEIEAALLAGQRVPAVSARYGVSGNSLRHHFHLHLSAQVAKGFDLRRIVAAKALAGRVELLLAETADILQDARTAEKPVTCPTCNASWGEPFGAIRDRVAAAAQVGKTLELVGRVSGQLSTLNVFFVKHGLRGEEELEQIITTHRQSSATTIEQCREDGVELLRWVMRERLEWIEEIRSALFPPQLTNGNGRQDDGTNGTP
jgi:hypothetical protein